MDDDVDIYDDLPSFNANECGRCEEKSKELTEKHEKLAQESLSWKLKYEISEEEKKIIVTNSSSLMKTARAEITRKDRTIMELRQELEDLKFKRGIWSKPKVRNTKFNDRKNQGETKKEEVLTEWIKISSVDEQPVCIKVQDEGEEETEQKWDSGRRCSTLYGARLQRKLWMEEEAERMQREEAKLLALQNDQNGPATSVKTEEQNKENETASYAIKLEPQSGLNDLNDTGMLQNSKKVESINGSLHSSEEDCKSRRNVERHCDETSSMRDERHNKDDIHYYNGNFNDDSRYKMEHNSRYEGHSRYPRDSSRHRDNDRTTRKHEEFEQNRSLRDKRGKSNYRSRSKTPERRYNDKKSDKHRAEKYRDYNDKYEKRRDDELPRDRYKNGTDYNRDLRDKLERRNENKIGAANDYDNYRNYDSDYKRRGKSRSPEGKSRSRSSGIRNRENDKRRRKRSRSREFLVIDEIRVESDNERENKKGVTRDPEIVNAEQNYLDSKISQPKTLEISRNSAMNTTDKLSLSRAPERKSKDPEISSVERNDCLANVEIMKESDTGCKDNKGDSKNSKIINSVETDLNLEIPQPKILVNVNRNSIVGEQERESKDSEIDSVGASHQPVNIEVTAESDEKRVNNKEETKDTEIITAEQNDLTSKISQPRTLESSIKNSSKDTTNSVSTSREPEASNTEMKTSVVQQMREDSIDNTEAATATLVNLVNQVEDQDKFILMLENDSEVPLSPLTRPEIRSIGSQSFREEKIENIEKFIQDYQSDENHVCLLGNEETEESNDENKFANSTSSIVETLSMDIEDDVRVKELGAEAPDNSGYSLSMDIEDTVVNQISEEDAVEKKIDETAVNEKLTDFGHDKESIDVAVDKKTEEIAIVEKMTSFDSDKKSEEIVIHEKMENIDAAKKLSDFDIDKDSEDIAINSKLKDVVADKALKVVADEKSRDLAIDKKLDVIVTDKKLKDVAVDKKLRRVTIDRKLEGIAIVSETKDITIDKKSKDVTGDIELRDVEIDDKSEDISLSSKSEKISEILKNVTVSKKLEDITIEEKSKDVTIEKKLVGDIKSRDVAIVHKSEHILVDKKLENVATDEISNIAVDKISENVVIIEKPKMTILDISPPLPISPESIPSPPLPISPESIPLPPLPPSPQLVPLPPLPPSPPPEKTEPEISVSQEIITIQPDIEKLQTEKAAAKQAKKRPRIPCVPILSLYSRKRREWALTDSSTIHTIVRSETSRDTVPNNSDKEKVKNPQIPAIEQQNTAPKLITVTKSSKLKEIQLENLTSATINETEKKTVSKSVPEVLDTSNSKKIDPIIAKTAIERPESTKPEVNCSLNVVTSTDVKKSEDELSAVSTSSKKRIVSQRSSKEFENKVDDGQPEVKSKRAHKSKNPDNNSTTEHSKSLKSSRRETRSALKTIASTEPTTDVVSSSRKRPLSKEKENQMKPAKEPKIMIIARRKPVQLEDSSTVTTLVSSEHEESSKDNSTKTPAKIDAPGRKRRTADK